MTKEFIEDLANLTKKHGVTMMSGNGENLVKITKGLEGHYMFFTKCEKILALRGGEKTSYESSTTIIIQKNRYGKK
jgi:hypothetical protein